MSKAVIKKDVMSLFMQWRFAARLLWREARSGELTLILVALLLAVTSATAISLFSSRLDAAMQQRSNDLLGADISSSFCWRNFFNRSRHSTRIEKCQQFISNWLC